MTRGTGPSKEPEPPLVLSAEEQRIVRALLAALRRIRYGSVQVVVQDGRVVQIDTLEKQRFPAHDDFSI
jgi:hypothetical protein